jgi:hypothetical protein
MLFLPIGGTVRGQAAAASVIEMVINTDVPTPRELYRGTLTTSLVDLGIEAESNYGRPLRVRAVNTDTSARLVTLKTYSAAGTASTEISMTLAAGDHLVWDEAGLRVVDSSGKIRHNNS